MSGKRREPVDRRKLVMSPAMLENEIGNAAIRLAHLMRGEWRDEPFDLIERACREFAKLHVSNLIKNNTDDGCKAEDLGYHS